jgi:hypothetical protein
MSRPVARANDRDRRGRGDGRATFPAAGIPEILGTLVSINREAGDTLAALNDARKLAAALPRDPGAQRLLTGLGASK